MIWSYSWEDFSFLLISYRVRVKLPWFIEYHLIKGWIRLFISFHSCLVYSGSENAGHNGSQMSGCGASWDPSLLGGANFFFSLGAWDC